MSIKKVIPTALSRTGISPTFAEVLFNTSSAMYLTKEYFDHWMQELTARLERIEQLYSTMQVQENKPLADGSKLLDNFDLCQMLNVSKRTIQRYRTSGELPYEMIYHKTFYREADVQAFIERNFDRFRNMKKMKRKL